MKNVCCVVMGAEAGAGCAGEELNFLHRFILLVGANLWAVMVRWCSLF